MDVRKILYFLIFPFCYCFDESKNISLTQDEDGHFSVHIGIQNTRNTIAWASLINGQGNINQDLIELLDDIN